GHTINLRAGVPLPAPDLELPRLLSELRDGQVGALLVLASNPVHAHPEGAALSDLLRRAPLTVSTNDRADETAQSCRFLAPDHAPAESWGDAEPRRGVLTLRQPALQPLFDTRSATESLLAWSGHPAEHHALVRSRVDALASRALRPEPTSAALWTRVQHEGHLEFHDEPLADTLSLSGLAHLLAAPSIARADTELWLHPSVSLRDGRHANNAWLHEVPDPLTKLVWDNAACMAPSRGDALGLRDGDLLRISAAGRSVELPVVLQPGTHPDVIAVSLGYGRTAAGTVGNGIGVNVAPLASTTPAGVRLFGPATFTPAGRARDLSRSQTHASLEGRPHIHTATLAEFAREATAGNP
ncbi:MAG: [Fe-S]-binding protein, partial [Deltaproteobacteria bacterium]|nr:[Fe-S]-binding protein [Deltaproteobacteria bacterium]